MFVMSWVQMMASFPKSRGFYGIGMVNGKAQGNAGILWRSAHIFGASFIFTVGSKYNRQKSDTLKTPKHIPLFHYKTVSELKEGLPWGCELIGAEMTDNAVPSIIFTHPERACYLLGAWNSGLSEDDIKLCDRLIVLPGKIALNVAVAGSIVIYDRIIKDDNK